MNRNRTSENRHLEAEADVRGGCCARRLVTICANVTVASLLLETDELCCISELVAAFATISGGIFDHIRTECVCNVLQRCMDNGPFYFSIVNSVLSLRYSKSEYFVRISR